MFAEGFGFDEFLGDMFDGFAHVVMRMFIRARPIGRRVL